jgi:hypothetical protein
MDKQRKSAAVLIFGFFRIPGETVAEFKAMSDKLSLEDKLQLASAIAHQQGLTQNDVGFTLVEYK